jgi:2-desacetyl-2-hydroxyethyl bacteriochlorophyllide A dehydrogenase
VTRRAVVFEEPGVAAVREEPVPQPGAGEALVRTVVSAISPGTEMLFYRGEVPPGTPVDASIGALAGAVEYPLRYGYAAVGRVAALGAGVPPEWAGRLVFAFQPHASHFAAPVEDLIPVPEGVEPEAAAFLPNAETAVTLALDGAPLYGERVAVFGQGVVGLLVTSLLARFPLACLVTVDRHARRRAASLVSGADASFGPEELTEVRALLDGGRPPAGADLAFELSGAPRALNDAIAVTGDYGRVVIGSWYGTKHVELDLGGRFHRSRMRLISSQVSTIAPELRGRWTRARRFEAAWRAVRAAGPVRYITHRFPVEQAPAAYALLDERPAEAIQVMLTYGES